MLLHKDIFKSVLVNPARSGANKLHIVSGYATAAMAFHHLETMRRLGKNIQIKLIVGMCSQDGLSLSNHRGFQKLAREYPDRFECGYVTKPPPVHSKVYAWFDGDSPVCGFTGSANYTQSAFVNTLQREIVGDCDAVNAFEYFNSLSSDTIYCNHIDVENYIKIYDDRYYQGIGRREIETVTPGTEAPSLPELPSVQISLLGRQDKLPTRSGLNWGQRHGREPNQAYIRVPADIYKTDFFPPRGVHFTVLTDDNKVLICTTAQENAKAIETPHNNSLIGEYFRNRIGVSLGAPVSRDDLVQYGRTDVVFYKIDNETYYMDFSV